MTAKSALSVSHQYPVGVAIRSGF